jgi:hypothetical protein
VVSILVGLPSLANGQGVTGRFEVSFLVGARRFVNFDPGRSITHRVIPGSPAEDELLWAEQAIGGRLGYRLNRTWGIEGTLASFAHYAGRDLAVGQYRGGAKVELSIGATAGGSFGRFRVAGRCSAGAMWMEWMPELLGSFETKGGTLQAVLVTVDSVPVVAIGMVAEVQGPHRLYIRGDLSDNLAWFGSNENTLNPRIVRHHPEFTVGVGWRFW